MSNCGAVYMYTGGLCVVRGCVMIGCICTEGLGVVRVAVPGVRGEELYTLIFCTCV